MDLLDQLLEVPRTDGVRRRGEAVAQGRDEFLELLDLERIGRLVDTVERRHVVVVEVLRDRLVRDEHELLDDPVRHTALGGDDLFHHALVVEDDLGLLQIEVDRAAAAAAQVEDLEQLAHGLEHRHEVRVLLHQRGIAIHQDGADVGVGHPCVAVNHAVVHFVADHRPLAIDLHQTGLHQAIDVRVQAAQPGRELGREHVDGAIRKVHRRATLVGLLVERAPLWNVVRHVGDVDAEPVIAVRQLLNRDRVVEIARVLAVDRNGPDLAEVRAPLEVLLRDRAAEALGLLDRFVAVLVGDAELADDDLGVDTGLLDIAEDLEHASLRAASGRRPAGDLRDDHVRWLRVVPLLVGDHHVHDQPPVERDEIPRPRVIDIEAADDRLRSALEDADDPSLRPILAALLDAGDDAVAVHGLVQVRPRDEDVPRHPLDRLVGDDEPEAARVRLHAPDDQVHPIRQAEMVSPRLNQVTGLDQLLQQAVHRRPLVAGDLQPLQQLPCGSGVLDLLADGRQELFAVQHRFHCTFPNRCVG